VSSYNKYRNRKTEIDGILFDSKSEARRYSELKLTEKCGIIKDLKLQVAFEIVPNQYISTFEIKKNGNIKENKKLDERKVEYIADFVYYDNELKINVVEDVKGMKTKEYIIKRKLFKYLYSKEYSFKEIV